MKIGKCGISLALKIHVSKDHNKRLRWIRWQTPEGWEEWIWKVDGHGWEEYYNC
jgi:hypothetical protein